MDPCDHDKTLRKDDRGRWGWRQLLAEATGVEPNQVDVSWEGVLDDRAQAMLTALRAARDELGRWPGGAEWEAAGWRPTPRTFMRHFGSWGGACMAAEEYESEADMRRTVDDA